MYANASVRQGHTIMRLYSTAPIIHIPKANIYCFGDSNSAKPVFGGFEWTVNEHESWAVMGSGKTALFQVCVLTGISFA
jgi:ABC-type molybdenum transport system ATPase subunit/photorepair protein PhrA